MELAEKIGVIPESSLEELSEYIAEQIEAIKKEAQQNIPN
jgi:FKBP-type peptidyl-prolyl cis-trans isomerase (trigger factor)